MLPLLLVSACTGDPYVVDPFAVSVDFYDAGIPLLSGCAPELQVDCKATPLRVVIDTGTAITTVAYGQDDPSVRRVHTSVDLESPGPGNMLVTRARFLGFTALAQPLGPIGLEGSSTPLDPGMVLGGDRLQTLAVRFDPNHGRVFFFPNIAGADDVLGRECSAVVPTTRLGGGDYLLDGAQISFPATRLIVGTCLNMQPNPAPLPDAGVGPAPDAGAGPAPDAAVVRPTPEGADALLLVSTGLPLTVLSRTAFDRACKVGLTTDPEACKTVATVLSFPGMPPGSGVSVQLGHLRWLGIAADEVRDGRGPCKEIWASRLMDLGGCSAREASSTQTCPCEVDRARPETFFCRAGASAEVYGPIEVAVVEDTNPLLQSLRDELRPVVADVDGFLGMNALRPFVTDFDYPGSRIIFRCEGARSQRCVVRPRLPGVDERERVLPCLGRQSFTAN